MERVLVCILAQTRMHELAWPSFKHQVLDELDADLALAVTFDENYDYVNPYWQHAKYRWTSYQPPDIAATWDLAQSWVWDRDEPPPDWRRMLTIKGIWQGGIRSDDPQSSFSANLLFSRSLLLRGLKEDGVLDRYDRFVVTRSDFVWLCPHPPMSVLDPGSIWIPDGEHYGGLCDRHIVLSRQDVVDTLSLLDEILLHPGTVYEAMKDFWGFNLEVYLKQHLTRKGMISRVQLFPYVMYTGRRVSDPRSTWSRGRYEPSVGHIVKNAGELRNAQAYATIIRTRADWKRGDWKTFDPERAAADYRPSAKEQIWSALAPIRGFVSALWRPGRRARFDRYLERRRAGKTEAG